jgi:hydrogenase nickel incorporation protein HypA/HybF
MHELSIAEEIISVVRSYLPGENNTNVKAVRIKIGKLSNILPESLLFCFNASIERTELEGAKLEMKFIPLTILCAECGKVTEPEDYIFACSFCGSTNIKVISGDELQIEEIELNN